MLILRDVYEAHEQVEGGPLNLSSTKKLSPAHFDSDMSSPDKMRVRPVAEVLSRTMGELVRRTQTDTIFTDKLADQSIRNYCEADRLKFFSKVPELVEKMDRWFRQHYSNQKAICVRHPNQCPSNSRRASAHTQVDRGLEESLDCRNHTYASR
jgi:hypothetical protein